MADKRKKLRTPEQREKDIRVTAQVAYWYLEGEFFGGKKPNPAVFRRFRQLCREDKRN